MRAFTLALAAAASLAAPAFAADVTGTWVRDTGASHVRFASCGGALCGTIAWLKPGLETPAKLGQRIFYDMKPSGTNAWSGSAFNPEDGKTYTGKMTLAGNTLTTQGCTLGGLICRSTTWTKVK